MRAWNSTKSALDIASSEFVILISVVFSSFFFLLCFQIPIRWFPVHQTSLQRHSVFLYRLSFECPTLRLLAGLVDDWQITFEISRCSMCRMQRLLSDFFLMTTVMLSFLISLDRLVSAPFFLLRSSAASISHGYTASRCSFAVSGTYRYHFINTHINY